MNESYERLAQYQRLQQLCRIRNIAWDFEPGDRMAFQGHEYIVAFVDCERLILFDDLTGLAPEPDRYIIVSDWENDPSCFFVPRMDQLLQIIEKITLVFPIMTPGVKETQSVWQVSHPNSPPIISSSLDTGLLELLIRILENQ